MLGLGWDCVIKDWTGANIQCWAVKLSHVWLCPRMLWKAPKLIIFGTVDFVRVVFIKSLTVFGRTCGRGNFAIDIVQKSSLVDI